MVTTKSEYDKLLAEIQDNYNAPIKKIIVPSTEPIYNIDLESRQVESPEFFGVQNDHQAETIFFVIDRHFGRVDLTNTIGIIQYKNAHLDEYVYVIPYYDIITKGGDKILFPWVIQGPVTKYKGNVEFSIRFFRLNENRDIVFDLNTRPAVSKVLSGWQTGIEDYSWSQVAVDAQWEKVIAQMQKYTSESPEPFAIHWIEADSQPVQRSQGELEAQIVNNLSN